MSPNDADDSVAPRLRFLSSSANASQHASPSPGLDNFLHKPHNVVTKPFTSTSSSPYVLSGSLQVCTAEAHGKSSKNFRMGFFRLSRTRLVCYRSVARCSFGEGHVPLDIVFNVPITMIQKVESHPASPFDFDIWIGCGSGTKNYPAKGKWSAVSDECVHRLRAGNDNVKNIWLTTLIRLMENPPPPEDIDGTVRQKEKASFRTNLGRLLRGGDDFDELELSSVVASPVAVAVAAAAEEEEEGCVHDPYSNGKEVLQRKADVATDGGRRANVSPDRTAKKEKKKKKKEKKVAREDSGCGCRIS